MENPWNSLEITKVLISAATPILVAIVAYGLNRRIKKHDKRQWTNQKLVEKRIEIYDKIVPLLNDLLCFHCYIGNWKEIKASEIIQIKRTLDKCMYVYAPLFSPKLVEKYHNFIELYYETFTGWGMDAKIKTMFDRRAEFSKVWDPAYESLFSSQTIEKIRNKEINENDFIKEKQSAYNGIIEEFQLALEIMKDRLKIESTTPNC